MPPRRRGAGRLARTRLRLLPAFCLLLLAASSLPALADDDGAKPVPVGPGASGEKGDPRAVSYPGLELMRRYALVMRTVPSCKELGAHRYPVHIPVDANFTARAKAVGARTKTNTNTQTAAAAA